MFSVSEYDLNNNIHLAVINIPQIDSELKILIDDNLLPICEGNSQGDIKSLKRELVQLFSTKNEDWKMGAIAEFFMHLYIRTKGYKQEFLYLNLEERSIKKGFDGLFSKDDDFWLMESKSGSIETKNISHKSKVKEAMKDLGNKVSGVGQSNNPWKNAYNHASHIDVNASDSLRTDLKKLSDSFIQGTYSNIKDFNTIPCGTIFLSGVWKVFDSKEIFQDINGIVSNLFGKNIFVICVTQKSIDMFLDYIKL